MLSRHPVWLALAMIFAATSLVGCRTHRLVDVEVMDASSGAPIMGATVQPHLLHVLDPFPPQMAGATTGANGRAIVSVITNYRRGAPTLIVTRVGWRLDQRYNWTLVPSLPIDRLEKGSDGRYRFRVEMLTDDAWREKYESGR